MVHKGRNERKNVGEGIGNELKEKEKEKVTGAWGY